MTLLFDWLGALTIVNDLFGQKMLYGDVWPQGITMTLKVELLILCAGTTRNLADVTHFLIHSCFRKVQYGHFDVKGDQET